MTCYANNSNDTSCPSHDCGNGVPIRYPFWRRSITTTTTTTACGYPDFGLECSNDGQPIFKLPTSTYYVKDINYETNSITLVDMDIVNQSCPRAKNNISLETFPLVYSPLDLNISFYFNCSSSYTSSADPISCMKNSERKQSFVYFSGNETDDYDWHAYCQEKIVVTVLKNDHEIQSGGLITGFGAAMNNGFVLDWMKAGECAECAGSGGFCGYDQTNNQFMCICKYDSILAKSCKKGYQWNWKRKVTIGVIAGLSGFIVCIIIICCSRSKSSTWKINFWMTTKGDQDVEAFLKKHGDLNLKRYKFSAVKKMTNTFKEKLGQGGFGAVYKGKLLTGCPVAVKILNASKKNGADFINEVASISRTSHVNVVALLGFSFEGQKKALIYEFMANGSLEKFVYKNVGETTPSLSWEILNDIAKGIARGLEYLHRGCNTRILHFDIKPHNILLDENFCPKISDFGLAKLCPRNESIISMSDARGTIGYVAPEVWNRHFGGVSHKSDVYSYGMMLLEMVGGRKNINAEASHSSEIYFPHWIYKKLEVNGDLGLNGAVATTEDEIAKRLTLVGLWCIQTFPNDRPTISKVIEMLEGNMNSLEVPPKPVLSSPTRSVPESSTT
ncbi:hypothetical protein TanjilG_22286 [Lupinus angustifolius]|uniref:non-specific serine/threonine protein kinase n=1 Tax=Lupinus angustifolius TaxID=3871 RepID=A0A1J7HPG5_LUPAN|nr:hypothetical protein TanjilG_22286 [Lupinus angustifolius]